MAWVSCTVALSRDFVLVETGSASHHILDFKNGLYVVFIIPVNPTDNGSSLANKPRGLQAARKLRNDRRENRWVCTSIILGQYFLSLKYDRRRTNRTRKVPSVTSTKPRPLEVRPTQRELCSRKSALRQNNLTLPFGNVSVCSSSRTERRSRLSYPYVPFFFADVR